MSDTPSTTCVPPVVLSTISAMSVPTVGPSVPADTLMGNALKKCVQLYLNHVEALTEVQPRKVRRAIAEACRTELSKFSSNVKNVLSRKSMSREKVAAVMNWKSFNHIPDAFKRVNNVGKRSMISRELEKSTLARLSAIIEG